MYLIAINIHLLDNPKILVWQLGIIYFPQNFTIKKIQFLFQLEFSYYFLKFLSVFSLMLLQQN